MKFVVAWISLLILSLGTITYADDVAAPNEDKSKNGGSVPPVSQTVPSDQAQPKIGGSVASADETAGPDIVKFKSGGAISVLYKHYEGDYVTIYLFDPRDGILVVKKSFLDEPPLTVIKTETKQKPVSKVKVKKRWRWKRK